MDFALKTSSLQNSEYFFFFHSHLTKEDEFLIKFYKSEILKNSYFLYGNVFLVSSRNKIFS